MWPLTFKKRLDSWVQMRESASNLPLDDSLSLINDWWFQAPWRPYYLHWDDRENWPDPWELLDDNVYCSLARALGIMYTIAIIDHNDITDAQLIQNDNDNLVLVNKRKYILNYEDGEVVNNNPNVGNIKKELELEELKLTLK